MLTFTNKQIVVFALVIGLIAGIFGNLIGMRIEMLYWRVFHPVPEERVFHPVPEEMEIIPPPVEGQVVPDPAVEPIIGDFEQLWLDGEVVRVNPEENYIVIQPIWPEDAEQVKVFLAPAPRIEQMKIIEVTIDAFQPGKYVVLETKEDVREKTVIKAIEMIQIVPPTPPMP